MCAFVLISLLFRWHGNCSYYAIHPKTHRSFTSADLVCPIWQWSQNKAERNPIRHTMASVPIHFFLCGQNFIQWRNQWFQNHHPKTKQIRFFSRFRLNMKCTPTNTNRPWKKSHKNLYSRCMNKNHSIVGWTHKMRENHPKNQSMIKRIWQSTNSQQSMWQTPTI